MDFRRPFQIAVWRHRGTRCLTLGFSSFRSRGGPPHFSQQLVQHGGQISLDRIQGNVGNGGCVHAILALSLDPAGRLGPDLPCFSPRFSDDLIGLASRGLDHLLVYPLPCIRRILANPRSFESGCLDDLASEI